MKVHTTNYTNTLIEVAEDCPAKAGEVPPAKGDKKTLAALQYFILNKKPYAYTSDDVLFMVYAKKNDIPEKEWPAARAQFFSKGQPCFRASPLTKRYGWGIHCNAESKIALYGVETKEYKELLQDKSLRTVKAMRSTRKKT